MTQGFVTDVKTCPKCSENMCQVEAAGFIPLRSDYGPASEGHRSSNQPTLKPLGVQLFYCPECRFVEMYAA